MSGSTIQFKEGAKHSVLITVATGITLTNYSAFIQVRDSYEDAVIFEFSTSGYTGTTDGTLVIGQNNQLYWEIPAILTIDRGGSYLWQLMLYTSETDIIKFDVGRFIIDESITFLP